jgi:hypothetical protein
MDIRNKGKTAERDVANALNVVVNRVRERLGLQKLEKPFVQRNQNQTAVGGADLVGTFGLCIEIKRQEQLSIGTWWKQCLKSAEQRNETPVLIYRQNNQPWRVVMPAMLDTGFSIDHPTHDFPVNATISWNDFLEFFERIVEARIYQK